jgi:hypothetical protein
MPSKISVSRSDVIVAIKEIDSGKKPMPVRRHSKDWCLEVSGRHYPPKYVLARAYYHKTGKALKGFKASKYTRDPLKVAGVGTLVKSCTMIPNCQTHIHTL